ncbi:hypothetical protein JKP88DRAFT_322648 [Tribonema minus]|uniref:GH26 domain-containing protein n=1 Tax=Tribonema minus TaxID=303371 RepID=A0A835YVQ8_9STRA|nr:hypothetical protein JKP88DRAFT_322648 [Tribonema minus]
MAHDTPPAAQAEPVVIPDDPTCLRGVIDSTKAVCCSTAACGGLCGGTGCETLAGGYYNCCAAGINELARPCSSNEAPCSLAAVPTPTPTAAAVSDPTCSRGRLNAAGTICCPADLCPNQCGGDATNCKAQVGGYYNCCLNGVLGLNKLCTAAEAPCTMVPTPQPTAAPTTAKPTAVPTAVPTTAAPTTPKPSAAPTGAPTTAKPTSTPTSTPTAVPTTAQPTALPTTATVTAKPTALPTAVPTSVPTSTPTSPPTTSTPTALPTTSTPTALPTAVPVTAMPTTMTPVTPSDPTCARGRLNPAGTICCPSDVCTTQCGGDATTCKAQPGGYLNCCLNGVYSLNRLCTAFEAPCTMVPTPQPTSTPTAVPTALPTALPTAAPTTAKPTALPTAVPTALPTAVPTALATTARPTAVPTAPPTTAAPTTAQPTSTPTAAPTTAKPTALPTPLPTAVPTASPTALPTATPTATPTAPPTVPQPTATPTTAVPTAAPTTAAPTSPIPTRAPSTPDPLCLLGTPNTSNQVCCPKDTCGGVCGGSTCKTLPGGYYECCLNGVLATNLSCANTGAPCIIPPTPKPTPQPTPSPTRIPSPADPLCLLGTPNLSNTVCCPNDSCNGQCGGSGCSALPGGFNECCPNGILAANVTCAIQGAPCVIPPTPKPTPAPTQTPTPAPSIFADPWCAMGTYNVMPTPAPSIFADPLCAMGTYNVDNSVCCPTKLCNGVCGGTGCQNLPGGSANCCGGTIKLSGVVCTKSTAPCVIAPVVPTQPPNPAGDPYCVDGDLAATNDICCDPGCTLCGKSTCATDPLGPDKCCFKNIYATGRSCDNTTYPCIVNTAKSIVIDPAYIRRNTQIGVLAGSDFTFSKRQTAWGIKWDNTLMYLPVQYLNWRWVKTYLDLNKDVQLVIEFVDSTANLAMVAGGKYDDYLKAFGAAAALDGRQIRVRPLHEFNADWYPWGVFRDGNSLADFRSAFVHVVQVLRATGANFLYQFSYAVQNVGNDATPFKAFYVGDQWVDQLVRLGETQPERKAFYVGDQWVDQICTSAYNMCGTRYLVNRPMATILGEWYYQPEWMLATWESFAYQFTRVTHINWFFENKVDILGVDWDLNSPDDLASWLEGWYEFHAVTTPLAA